MRVIMLVTTATVVALGVPLAFAVHRAFHGDAVVRLQRRAALAIGEVTLPLDAATVARALSEPDDPPDVGVYDQAGALLTGPGPSTADNAVEQALRGQPAAKVLGASLVVATPLNDRATERVVGAVRVSTPESTIWHRTFGAWALMSAVAAVALAGAWLAARRQSSRLATPISALARRAEAVGAGQLPESSAPSGINEVDAVAEALQAGAVRLAEMLARERAFSSDVSHQLRTPLTRLRFTVEALGARPDAGLASAAALREIDQIEATVDHLLALARGRHPRTGRTDPFQAVDAAVRRWTATADGHGRRLVFAAPTNLTPVVANRAALDQVLDVLLDNATRHGAGTISVTARHAPGGVAIEVADEGCGLADAAAIFDRAEPDGHTERAERTDGTDATGHGIGLPLARTLVEADGGRLTLLGSSPTTFQIVYPNALDLPADG